MSILVIDSNTNLDGDTDADLGTDELTCDAPPLDAEAGTEPEWTVAASLTDEPFQEGLGVAGAECDALGTAGDAPDTTVTPCPSPKTEEMTVGFMTLGPKLVPELVLLMLVPVSRLMTFEALRWVICEEQSLHARTGP